MGTHWPNTTKKRFVFYNSNGRCLQAKEEEELVII